MPTVHKVAVKSSAQGKFWLIRNFCRNTFSSLFPWLDLGIEAVVFVATTDDGRPRPRALPPRPEHIHDQVLRVHEGPASERAGQCRREKVFLVSSVNSLFVHNNILLHTYSHCRQAKVNKVLVFGKLNFEHLMVEGVFLFPLHKSSIPRG